jgi:hypothetical protein
LELECVYPKEIYGNSQTYKAKILLKPGVNMPNLPVEVELRGNSQLHKLNSSESNHPSLEITEGLLFEDEDKGHNQAFQANPSILVQKNQQSWMESEQQGEYFLEGCQVLYQLHETTRERLEELSAGKKYSYPVEFVLPPRLPVSLTHKLLKHIHITITYTLELKIHYPSTAKI